MSDATVELTGRGLEPVLREVVERLAPLDRTPCSAGEREAAEWLAERFRRVDGVDVELEDEPSWGTFPPTGVALGALGVLAALLSLRGRTRAGALLAGLSIAGIVDEAQNGPRIVRRLLRRRRTTVNLIARAGEREAREGVTTLVVLAHHDAPQTGLIFDQSLQKTIYERWPEFLERFKTPLPNWWFGLSGPVSTLAAALTRRRSLARNGLVLGTLATGLVADIARSQTVQGANDNLSGVAALVALAELVREKPIDGLRLMLISCGAEETLQDGIRAFISSHRHELDPRTTCFVNLDTVGSPHLVLLEAEGPVWMESYCGPWIRDQMAACAASLGIELIRGYRARASTDSVIPSRAGYPIVTLVSMTDWFAPANYHLPTDVPENLDYAAVADATRLTFALAQQLASPPARTGAGA